MKSKSNFCDHFSFTDNNVFSPLFQEHILYTHIHAWAGHITLRYVTVMVCNHPATCTVQCDSFFQVDLFCF